MMATCKNICPGLHSPLSAQWEMVKGNTFSYTDLAVFGKLHISIAD